MKCNCTASLQIHMSIYKTTILDKNLGFFHLAHFLPESHVPADAAQLSAAPGCHLAHGHQPVTLQPLLSSGRDHWDHSGTASTPQSLCQSNCGKTKDWKIIQTIAVRRPGIPLHWVDLPSRTERLTHSLVNQVLVLKASWHSSSWWKPTAQTVINFQLKKERAVLSKLLFLSLKNKDWLATSNWSAEPFPPLSRNNSTIRRCETWNMINCSCSVFFFFLLHWLWGAGAQNLLSEGDFDYIDYIFEYIVLPVNMHK